MRRCRPVAGSLSPDERLQGLVLAVVNILAPVPEKTLHSIASYLRLPIARAPNHRKTIQRLISAGKLERQVIDGLGYLWPAGTAVSEPPPRRVRFLAPFDPVVWDRRRFEHLWGWPYRFEAYTPAGQAGPRILCDAGAVVRSGNRVGKCRHRCKQVDRADRLCRKAARRIANSNRNWKPRLPAWRHFSIAKRHHEPRRGRCPHLPGGAKLRYSRRTKLSSFARLGR